MKRLGSATMMAACILVFSGAARAQDCSDWSNWDLRGTYTMSGNGFVDLSKILPGAGLPSGAVPLFWVGAHTLNCAGGGTGWVFFNAAGSQFGIQFTISP